jgi:hypothetical protein
LLFFFNWIRIFHLPYFFLLLVWKLYTTYYSFSDYHRNHSLHMNLSRKKMHKFLNTLIHSSSSRLTYFWGGGSRITVCTSGLELSIFLLLLLKYWNYTCAPPHLAYILF